jgi:hypothetical protein
MTFQLTKHEGNELEVTLDINSTFATDGLGYWSGVAKRVNVFSATIIVDLSEDECDGDLRIQFDTDMWDCERDGLIYTDETFIKMVREAFAKVLPQNVADGICYSEQGMQDYDYVSCDAYELANYMRTQHNTLLAELA